MPEHEAGAAATYTTRDKWFAERIVCTSPQTDSVRVIEQNIQTTHWGVRLPKANAPDDADKAR